MKKTNRKGFTIVELVIVIAVIAILAAVMIPTFSNLVGKANESAALQEATAAYKQALVEVLADGKVDANETVYLKNGAGVAAGTDGIEWTFVFADQNNATVTVADATFGYTVAVADGEVTVTKA